jgi:tRNA nucleotidyltransferase (CCA-adding enzyme)
VVAREHGNVHRSGELNAAAVLRLLERCDAIRKPERFAEVLLACECDARGRLGFEETPYAPRERLLAALRTALSVETTELARTAMAQGRQGKDIGALIQQARTQALEAMLASAPRAS